MVEVRDELARLRQLDAIVILRAIGPSSAPAPSISVPAARALIRGLRARLTAYLSLP